MIRDTSAQDQPLEDTRSRRWLVWVAVGLAAVIAAGFAVPMVAQWGGVDASISEERLRFGTVERGPFVRDVSAQGRVVAANSPTLYSPAAGTVRFDVQAGRTVEQNQLLVTLHSPELTNRLEQERAGLLAMETEYKRRQIEVRQRRLAQKKLVDQAKVALTAADREMRRSKDGFELQVVSEFDYERARDELEQARLESEHAVSEAALLNDALSFELETEASNVERQRLLVSDMERQVTRLEIRSPVTGIVGNLLVAERAWVEANQPLVSVVDLTAFEVDVQIPESYADSLSPEMPAELSWNGREYAADVSAVSPEVNNNQVTARLRFTDAVPAGLRQNQRLSARILLENKPDVLFVRRGAFYDSGTGRIAYVVDDQVAQKTSIVTGATSVEKIEILDGLDAGQQIIISSIEPFNGADRVLLN